MIRGYRAVVDPEALGLVRDGADRRRARSIRRSPTTCPSGSPTFPEVEDCYSVAGEASYVLKVRTRTTGELEDLIRRLREKAGVATRTTIALSIPFEGRPLRT